jgi:6-phospho-beta-glucosidase
MGRPRIVVVGAGSQRSIAQFESFVHAGHGPLKGAEVVLLDIQEEHLRIVEDYATRLATGASIDISFEATTDRRRAFDGADYILTTFRPGTFDQLEQDEKIPPRHGLQGNETVGVGGIFMACRVAPVLRAILADADELCPAATIINYTNPTQYVADMVGRLSDMRVISLCDGHLDVYSSLAHVLGVDRSEIEISVAGTNHAIWVMDFTVGGQEGYPLLHERLAELEPEELSAMLAPPSFVRLTDWAPQPRELVYQQLIPHYQFEFSLKLLEIYGLLAGPRYYWRYLLEQDAIVAAQRAGTHVTMSDFYRRAEPTAFEGLEDRLAVQLEQLRRATESGVASSRSHAEIAVRAISSMVNDDGGRFVVNVPNRGAISNLPDDAIVEISAIVDAQGAHPLAVGPLPSPLIAMQLGLVHAEQLAVEAALTGDRRTLLQALVSHPTTHSVAAAEACIDDMLAAQAEWLPQFATAVPA